MKSNLFQFKTVAPCPITTGPGKKVSVHLSGKLFLYIERPQYGLPRAFLTHFDTIST